MTAHILGIGRYLMRNLSTLAILGCMVLIGIWGHHTKWSLFPKQEAHAETPVPLAVSADVQEAPSSAGTTEAVPDADPAIIAKIAPDAATNSLTHIAFKSPDAVRKSGIGLAEVVEQSMDIDVEAHGVILYDQTMVAQLAPRVAGTVWRVEKQVGQEIHKGDVLAIIEAVGVGEAKSRFLQAIVNCELKEKTWKRLEALEVVPERQRNEAQAAVREARIALHNAQQTLVNLGLPISIEDTSGLSEQELVRRVQFLGLPTAIISNLDPATTTTNLIPLLAPFDGVVIGRDASVGESVSPEHSTFVVADNSRMWIYLDVKKEDAGRLRLGQEICFKCDDGHEEVNSKLTWVSTEVDPKTRTVRVRAEVENPITENQLAQRRLRANMFGTGSIRVREQPNVVAVPSDAVHWDGKQHVVFVRLTETVFESRPVKVGSVIDNYTEILEGVKAGERIAEEGSHLLKAEIIRRRMTASNPAAGNSPSRLTSFLLRDTSLLAHARAGR